MKRKLEKPEVKIVKLQTMDVIATSGGGDTPAKSTFNLSGASYAGSTWYKQLQ